jgi:peroxiredoxin
MRKYFFAAMMMVTAFVLAKTNLAIGLDTIAPNFQLKDLAGNTVGLSEYKGKQDVLLFFWTTWCPYCRRGLKVLNEKHAQLSKDGVEILAINVSEPAYKVDSFVRNYALTFKTLLDPDADVAMAYKLLGFPTYIIVDKEGYIRSAGYSFPEEEYKDLILHKDEARQKN